MTGEELKAWRKKMALTQVKAAGVFSMSRRSYQRWEKLPAISTELEFACIAIWHNHKEGERPWLN